ncbi:uncharacterized protein LOC127180663 [Labeo rohita]|uniref:uncharacterized protein LOC127180663 n=1 Tax=Labeo rohita TaxID=84645 RepID=UPI0021E27574|nr:uncharacterized protein LOC127180663 [Labeo rohita]
MYPGQLKSSNMVAEKTASAGELKAALQSPLTLTLAVVAAVVVGYALISGVAEPIVGAVAGAAAGVGVLQLQWEKEERTAVAVAVTAVAGGAAGAAAAVLRSLMAAKSLTGAALFGAIAGAAVVALAKKQIIEFIKWSKLVIGVVLVTIGATLLNFAVNAVKWLKDMIKSAFSKLKEAVQWITEAAKKLFNTLASFGTSGLAAIAAGIFGSVALASAAASGLASIGTAIAGLFGGLLGLGLFLAAGAAVFELYRREQPNNQQTQGADVAFPIIVLLLFVLFCFFVSYVGVWRFCLLLFLSLFLWFVLCYRSERH